jgi:hypothetical protein
MKKAGIIICLLTGSLLSSAQDFPANAATGKKNPYPFISSLLLNLYEEARTNLTSALEKAERFMLVKDQRIYLELVNGSQTDTHLPIDNEMLRRLPEVQVTTTFVNRSSAWAPVNKLLEIGQMLPPGYRLSEALLPIVENQGPSVINSDSYSGTGGAGLLIAVIDSGFDSLTEARAAAVAPTAANTTQYDYSGTGIETTTQHGTACLETVFDHVPNAQYNIFKVASPSDLGVAVNQCVANGVDIISHSMSQYNTGWDDDSGFACVAASYASSNGILFFTASGNRYGQHWQGDFNNDDGDQWHSWSGSDEGNNITIQGNGSITVLLQWNSSSLSNFYDLYLTNSSSSVIASSTNTTGFEGIYFINTSSSAVSVNILVERNTASPPALELFITGNVINNLEYHSTQGSTASPSNSTAANVISVGAVDFNFYSHPPGAAGLLASYSSRGPTNNGNQAPDIVGPTETTALAYAGAFAGTSCSTPNAAGAAAAFWSGHPSLSADGVRQILLAKADIYKDWGANGTDNLYGNGGVYLNDYHSLNRYVLSSAGNTSSLPTLPYFSIQDIDNDTAVPDNLRIYYLDKNATAPGPAVLINKPMLYRSLPGTTID